MKKLFALLLAAAMVLSMAACGGKTDAPRSLLPLRKPLPPPPRLPPRPKPLWKP